MYGRTVRLDVGRGGQDGRRFESRRGVPSIRMAFRVTADEDAEANTGEVTIWNLARETREWLDAEAEVAVLSAGYGDSIGEIWQGDLSTVTHVRQGDDWLTTIEGGDADVAITHGHVALSAAAGTTHGAAIDACVEALGLSVGFIDPAAREPVFGRGVTLQGNAVDELRSVVGGGGFTVAIQGGALYVYPVGRGVEEVAVVLSPRAGLQSGLSVLREERRDDSRGRRRTGRIDRDQAPRLRFDALVDARIRPGRRVQLEQTEHDGLWVVRRCDWYGDSMDGGYGVTVEASASEAS